MNRQKKANPTEILYKPTLRAGRGEKKNVSRKTKSDCGSVNWFVLNRMRFLLLPFHRTLLLTILKSSLHALEPTFSQ